MQDIRKPMTLKKKIAEYLAYLSFLVFPLLLYFVFCILPSLQAVYYSFFKWNGFADTALFIGLKNYIDLFTKDMTFAVSMKNTVIYTIVVVIFQNIISLMVAVLIAKKNTANNLYRTLFYLPVIFSPVTIGFIWSFIYDPNIGVLNALLDICGLGMLRHVWLGEKTISIIAIAAVHVWWGVGQGMVLYIAGLQNIPMELLEGAVLDGCNRWQQFWHITFPTLLPVVAVVVVLTTIGSFRTFELVYTMTGGGADNSSMVLALQSYKEAFTFSNIGFSSAIAVILLVIVGTISFVQLKLFDRK
jgi:raffinose/stachyose/melibiose transport system permease protein